MRDILHEIFESMKRNRLRTTLTGLSVSWGIFILVVLLGAGNGLKNGVMSNFGERAKNMITLRTNTTSMPYKGLKTGRSIDFTDQQTDLLKNRVDETEKITPVVSSSQKMTYENNFGEWSLMGVMPEYHDIFGIQLSNESRFVNQLDLKDEKKVIVIDKKIAKTLFKEKSPIGENIKVGELIFKVIGVNTKAEQWGNTSAYIPYTTAQTIFNSSKKFGRISFTVKGLETEKENNRFNDRLRNMMGHVLDFDPKDYQAMWVNNSQKEYIQSMKIFGAINIFVGVIGILTLIAGIVGVSNIMLVTVKERTREIGIRKAIGAPSWSILKSIVLESIIITGIFGYIGMITGIGLTELVNFFMEQSTRATADVDAPQMSVFKNPTVGLGLVLLATTILIIAGVIAGYLPARKAVKIKPIEAMRQE